MKNKIKNITPPFILNLYRILRYGSQPKQINKLEESLKGQKNTFKIIYALTPPALLPNIGDHAQVVAIYKWLQKNYPNTPIIEVDKDDCINQVELLKKHVNNDDLIFIHSGGNLGDRGIWSETGRRNIIENFPNNKIVVLPQTIYFSDTETGNKEKEVSKEIYNKHKSLTVIGRDYESLELAKELFPNAKPFAIPDFVLSLKKEEYSLDHSSPSKKALFCLRDDSESIFSQEEKDKFPGSVGLEPYDFFDTTLPHSLELDQRNEYVQKTLNLFSDFEVVITDRFHGVIFATILNKPIVVLPTVDHKLTSAIEWFNNMPQIKLLKKEELANIQDAVKEVIQAKPVIKDWNKLYFDNLKERL